MAPVYREHMSAFDGLSEREWQLVHSMYVHGLESIERNEEMGERRLQLLFTVASAAAVAVGLVADGNASTAAKLWTAAGAAITVSLLGLLTVRRLARRNSITTELVHRLHEIRKDAAEKNEALSSLFVRDPAIAVPARQQAWLPTKGGLVDIAGCATAAFLGAGVLCAGLALKAGGAVMVGVGVAVAILAWLGQVGIVRLVYKQAAAKRASQPPRTKTVSQDQFFRAGVGIVVVDGNGRVLALERADAPGAWQLPQGGLEAGEEALDAARRELWEETGLSDADVELLDEATDWLAYELPPSKRSAKTGRGQVQRWFLFRIRDGVSALAPRMTAGTEARTLAWLPYDKLVEDVVEFRRDVYDKVGTRFGL
jgi:putative (di)nucleoside polyphosphate hydrolase